MFGPIKAVIFDMDGVLVDSEPLWRKAMIKGFNSYGVAFTEQDCRKTTGMRFKEVVDIWLNHYDLKHITNHEVETNVLDALVDLIGNEGKPMPGALEALNYVKQSGLKIGLATSSSHRLLSAVLKKLELENFFQAEVSAESMAYGKPHPEVFLVCAELLDIYPNSCLVIEDSINGVIAAKAAQMRAIAVPDIEHMHMKQFAVADYQCESMQDVLKLFKELF